MCDGIVLNDQSITTITTVGRAEEVFGKKAIEWNPWCEDYACENGPRDGYGPHAPRPTDCLCCIDIVATVRRAGYDFNHIPTDRDGDSECFIWSAITPQPSPLPRGMMVGVVMIAVFFFGVGT